MKKVFVTGQYQIYVDVPDTWAKEDIENFVIDNLEVNDGESKTRLDWASANVEE